MATTLNIDLSDNEQAKVTELAATIAPGMSPAEVKAWAEAEAKRLLRDRIVGLAQAARREAENTARRTADDEFEQSWPGPVDAVEPEPV